MEEVKITDVYSGNINRNNPKNDREFSRETGFPSPARDHYEKPLSLDEHLIHRPAATYFVRINGDNMRNAGIFAEDLLVVDRSIEPVSGHLVIVLLDGEHVVRRLERKNGNLYFCTESEAADDIAVTKNLDYTIWGVVNYTIHKHI